MNAPTATTASTDESASQRHAALERRFEGERQRLAGQDARYSTWRLIAFLAAGALIASGIFTPSRWQLAAGGFALVGFVVLVMRHLGVLQRLEAARVRRDVHRRHLLRAGAGWLRLPEPPAELFPPDHAYAWDIDLCGPGSLVQRIDVTHTRLGQRRLAAMLGQAASPETIALRQAAVAELAPLTELRQELEAHAEIAGGEDKLDATSFRKFTSLPSLFAARGWLYPLSVALPLLSLALYVAGELGRVPSSAWMLTVTLQLGLLIGFGRRAREAFDLAEARKGVVDAFEGMLRTLEQGEFESAELKQLREQVHVDGVPASSQMKRLTNWVGLAALRHQFLIHVFVNPLTLWDLHVLRGLERWNRDVGSHSGAWFEALAELEALASLATLAALEPDGCLPQVVDADASLEASGLAHPLLAPDVRVANDVRLRGPGTALMVTGSNMAGKSTLLRAVGLNVALALCGGPVCARRMRVPLRRLRAAMRAQDSLQQGASYFHAELKKLRLVVEDAEASPPVLFLLDELLRGTNERARHVGAKAVVLHLLQRRGSGLVATHDTALAQLEDSRPEMIANVHFTDVVEQGEMRFDYKLRAGIVRTSNALRLLAMAGIEVPEEDQPTVNAATPTHEDVIAPDR